MEKGNSEQIVIRDELETVYLSDTLSKNYIKRICLERGEYILEMSGCVDVSKQWQSSLLLYNMDDELLESFSNQGSIEKKNEYFFVGDLIPFQSQFSYLYSSNLPAEWIDYDYDVSHWKKGNSPDWESSEIATHVFLRHSFSFPERYHYSFFMIKVHADWSGVMYLNGKLLRYFTLVTSAHMTTIIAPISTYLSTNNVLAIEITSNSKSFVFDLSLHVHSTQCISKWLHGSAHTENISNNNPFDAFSDSSSWESKQVPITLIGEFERDSYIMPTSIHISTGNQYIKHPIAFSIYGQIYNHTSNEVILEDLLTTINNTLIFRKQTTENIQVNSNNPYNVFRFVFSSSTASTVLLSNIHFIMCQQGSCSGSYSRPQTSLGNSIYSSCPIGSYGYSKYSCIRMNNQPTWQEDLSMCIQKHPSSSYHYIDCEFIMKDARSSMIPYLIEASKTTFKPYLSDSNVIYDYPIQFPYIESNIPNVQVVMRLTVNRNESKIVYKRIKENYNDMISSINTIVHAHDFSIVVQKKPHLYSMPFVNLIILIIIAVIIVSIPFTILTWIKLKKQIKIVCKKEEQNSVNENLV